jgi:hypothetical protein
MRHSDPTEDGNAMHLERRWFAADRAAAALRAECAALAHLQDAAEAAWRAAHARLAYLEALRDAFGGELAAAEARDSGQQPAASARAVA